MNEHSSPLEAQDTSSLFGELRSLLQAAPSASSWEKLVQIFDACAHDEAFVHDVLAPYARAHIGRWPPSLCLAPRHWIEPIFSPSPPPHHRLVKRLDLSQRGLADADVEMMSQHATLAHVEQLDLSHNWLMASGVEHLCRSPHAHSIEHLDLSYNQLRDQGAERFAGTNTLNNLKWLSVARNDLSVKGFVALQEARFIPSLTHLDVSSNWLRPTRDDPFIIGEFASLRSLVLSHNQITDTGVVDLLDGAEELLPSLERLDIAQAGLTHETARGLAWSPIMAGIRQLDISHNRLGSEGAHLFFDSPHLRRLEDLDLSSTNLHDDALLALSDSPHLVSLQRLDLSRNAIGHLGVTHLAQTTHLSTLKSLSLAHNELNALAVHALCGWAQLLDLEELDLAANDIQAAPLVALLSVLQANTSLRALVLDHNQLLPRPSEPVYRQSLEQLDLSILPPALERLCLLNCQLHDESLASLVESQAITQLRHLDLRYNGVGDDFARALVARYPVTQRLELDVRFTNMSIEGLTLIKEKLPLCELVR